MSNRPWYRAQNLYDPARIRPGYVFGTFTVKGLDKIKIAGPPHFGRMVGRMMMLPFGKGGVRVNILQIPNAVFLVGLVVQCGIRQHFVRRTKSETKAVRRFDRTEKLLLAAMFPPVLLLPLIYFFTPVLSFADYPLPEFVRWAGAAVMAASLWLFWRSHVDLGQNWSVSLELRENHQLVSHGVYRWVRHPMYASIWLWGIAQGLMLANWFAGWSVMPAFAAMYFIRTPREERLMCEEFGDEYRAYARRTGSLFPRLTTAADPKHLLSPPGGPASNEPSSPPGR